MSYFMTYTVAVKSCLSYGLCVCLYQSINQSIYSLTKSTKLQSNTSAKSTWHLCELGV